MTPTCAHGHELTDDNIVMRHGRPRCRTCERIHGARYRAKRRATVSTPVSDEEKALREAGS
jgi:hypothetical protein